MHIDTPSHDDADDLADLWVDLAVEQRQYDSHLRPEANRDAMRDRILRNIVSDGVRVALAEESDDHPDGTIVGFVTFGRARNDLTNDVVRGVIQNLYVRPDCRDQTIGGELLDTATVALKDRGVDVVSLDVMADNEDARRFYRRHGFTPHRVQLERSVENDTHSKE